MQHGNESNFQLVLDVLNSDHEIDGHDQNALERIVELTGTSLNSAACLLLSINSLESRWGLASCYARDGDIHQYLENLSLKWINTLPSDLFEISAKYTEIGWLDFHNEHFAGTTEVAHSVSERYNFETVVLCPLHDQGILLGYLILITSKHSPLNEVQKVLLRHLTKHATVMLIRRGEIPAVGRYRHLGNILRQVDEARSIDEVLHVVLDGALQLTGATRGWVSRLDDVTTELGIDVQYGNPTSRQLYYGQGITGAALKRLSALRADDVHADTWCSIYEEFWKDTCSELAVPIFIHNARVRTGHEIILAPKPIGVINLESPSRSAFSASDESLLVSLASHAAVVIDRMTLDIKSSELALVKQLILGNQGWDEIVEITSDAIRKALRYSYVSVSVVDSFSNTIKPEYVIGLPKDTTDEFMRLATNKLDGNDIQSHIFANQLIEVPEESDLRFDRKIIHEFGLDTLIRVSVPMVASSSKRVIGTIEVGYRRADWRYIFEDDVQVLKQFVDYVAEALDRRRHGLLDEITHELRAPVVGIRNNLSYLERHINSVDREFALRKIVDMSVDCELLLYQIAELELFLGRPPRVLKIERTLVFRDVVIAAIEQLKPEIREKGFDQNKIIYNPEDNQRIGALYVDRAQLKQVVFHLVLNAIKYSEDDPEQFTISISVTSTIEEFAISFKDWGIGIREEYCERVFESGFRAPEAKYKNVSGSGLGLTITRNIMRKLGGDLRLVHNRKPTEFVLTLPKRLKEDPNDSVH